MKKLVIILAALLVVGIMFIGWYINGLNRIVRMHETVKESWAEIDNQLKRRSDLIPNLVNTVKGYAGHEKEVFTHIADARAKLAGAQTIKQKIDASNRLESALSRLLVIVERYPDLKANISFQRLMDELSGTENRIAVARMRYNREVKTFNAHIREVIGGFFARRRGLTEPFEYFEIAESDKAVPEVKF
ncbi:MAG: LemA family protein [Elusimicrobiota bacterium]